MMRSLAVGATASLVVLIGCSHSAPPPAASSTQTTSASAELRTPPESDRRLAELRDQLRAPSRHTVAAMDHWAGEWPGAAALLARWMQDHRQTAVKLASWQHRYPERMSVLVEWASGHQVESLGAFLFDRPGWEDLEQIALDDRSGVQTFLLWARTAPTAALEMAQHGEGLAYAEEHFADYAQLDPNMVAASQQPAKGTELGLGKGGGPQKGRTPGLATPPTKLDEPAIPPEEKAPVPKVKYPY